MKILLAKTAGFCFGVKKAVNTVDKLINSKADKIFTFGPIIHNVQVVNNFKNKGVRAIEKTEEIESNFNIVIRAHGISPQIKEIIQDKNANIFDATCPIVIKIQKLVEKKFKQGYIIIIVGDANHPEVIGIKGYAGNEAFVVYNKEDIKFSEKITDKICVVAQTTITKEKWTEITNILKETYTNIELHDTICGATSERQEEALEISKKADIMLVVGGIRSSNTQKLYEICLKNCKNTYKIETANDIPSFLQISLNTTIGIAAGASTPDWIIEEVYTKMNEFNQDTVEEEMDFATLVDKSMKSIHNGEVVRGKIIGYNMKEVFVDLGYKSDGIIPAGELGYDIDLSQPNALAIGSEIEVFVIKVNDGDGNVALSKRKVDSFKSWDKIVESYEKKLTIKARVKEIVKGGLIAVFDGGKIFVPASQACDRFVKDLHEFINTDILVRIIELNEKNRRSTGSARIVLEEAKKHSSSKAWEGIEVNKKFTGTVKNITDFGAFVDIGGVDGLIHISELSWARIKHPSEVVTVGDSIEVRILEFDPVKKKISLGYKNQNDNPWAKIEKTLKAGDIIECKANRITTFGVFVELEPGVDGLVHISQISDMRINKVEEVLKLGQVVKAKVLEADFVNKKISLSIKDVAPINPHSNETSDNIEIEGPTEHTEEVNNTIGNVVGEIEK